MKHLYYNDVTEWFVAESLEQATEAARKYYDDVLGECAPDPECLELRQEPDDKSLDQMDESYKVIATKTCGEWAAESPIGFWGTTEL